MTKSGFHQELRRKLNYPKYGIDQIYDEDNSFNYGLFYKHSSGNHQVIETIQKLHELVKFKLGPENFANCSHYLDEAVSDCFNKYNGIEYENNIISYLIEML